MKKTILLPLLVITLVAIAQSKDEKAIRRVLDDQINTWNRGDVEGFMKGYWQSDSLMFIGKNGITRGWAKTLDRYKKSYPDTAAMGKLSYDILVVKRLSSEYYYVVGKWLLKRSIGDLGGYYNLLFKKIGGQWFIITDHTS
jgi:ketosteroid isomerase-like protein